MRQVQRADVPVERPVEERLVPRAPGRVGDEQRQDGGADEHQPARRLELEESLSGPRNYGERYTRARVASEIATALVRASSERRDLSPANRRHARWSGMRSV
ncbi:MAG: hypothetical protein AMXMBFR22_22170 [Phycisphaerae bacterium]